MQPRPLTACMFWGLAGQCEEHVAPWALTLSAIVLQYMYCMGLNYEEWAEDVDPKQATNPKQTGKQVWEVIPRRTWGWCDLVADSHAPKHSSKLRRSRPMVTPCARTNPSPGSGSTSAVGDLAMAHDNCPTPLTGVGGVPVAAWKDYHRRMIEEDKLASHDQKTEQRIQKQLKDELHRLKKWFSQGEQRSCWEGYTCIEF